MKNLLLILPLLVLAASINAQCVLKKKSCNGLTVQLTNVPHEYLTEKEQVSRESGRPSHSDDRQLLSYVLEKEIMEGVWKGVETKDSDELEVSFSSLGAGVYRVTCLVNSANRKKQTRIQKEGRQSFSLDFDGFSSNKMTLEPCNSNIAFTNEGALNDKISIFPNPTKDNLSVKGIPKDIGDITVSLYDLDGRKLLSRDFTETSFDIDVSSIQSGVFFFEVKSKENVLLAVKKVTILK